MATVKKLTSYAALLYPNSGKKSARINLTCEDHKLYILFVDPADPLPANSFDAATRVGVAYQRFDQYSQYVDLVRNEKPISVTFRPEDKPPVFVVYCAGEPPGDGEV